MSGWLLSWCKDTTIYLILQTFSTLNQQAIVNKAGMSEWKTYKLGEIASFISRGVTPFYSDDGVIVINQKCIRDGKVSFDQARFTNPTIKIKT